MADKSKKIDILANLLSGFFKIQAHFVNIKNNNYPQVPQAIFATWHGYQMSFYCVPNHQKLNVLISSSNDGEIIARATEGLGIKVVRGSQGRGGTQATFQLLEKIEQGENIGIAVDGPRGPAKVVKKGIINIAKLSQVPIVPLVWHSPAWNLLKFPSWDSLTLPVGFIKLAALYGEPIYVPPDIDDEGIEIYRQKLETALLEIDKRVQSDYAELIK